jgi:hypothetical protein
MKWILRLFNERGANETTTTTITETIPTAVAAALLVQEEQDVILPLVTRVDFPGPGVVHNTPFINKLTPEADESLANQALDSGTYQAASAATVANHGSTVFLKELAMLGSTSDMMAVAGQIIGQSCVTSRDAALAALFTSFTQNEGGANVDITPADLFAAYNFLRKSNQQGPYNLVLYPGQIWGTVGLINLFANTADANHFSGGLGGGVGSVGEEFMRNGFSGRIFGFDLYADANIVLTSNNASGAAFGRRGLKYVSKRPFRIDVLYNGPEVGWQITGTEMWGAAVLEDNAGDEMQFNENT